MSVSRTVDYANEPLEGLLGAAHDGRIQVPEFQRELFLEDESIKSLLASVSLGYPIGALTLLQSGNPDVRFDVSPIAGTPLPSRAPERLVIDGQGRMTSLYQVLASGEVVQTKDDQKRPAARWYYIDIHAALDPDADRDDAMISVPESRQARTQDDVELDLSAAELEWEQCVFPLRLVFCADGERRRWQRGFAQHGTAEGAEARDQLMDRFEREVLQAFEGYVLPTITVGKEWARWSVRVHGGPEGPSLSDRFRVTDRS
jgi:hypothetical protein